MKKSFVTFFCLIMILCFTSCADQALSTAQENAEIILREMFTAPCEEIERHLGGITGDELIDPEVYYEEWDAIHEICTETGFECFIYQTTMIQKPASGIDAVIEVEKVEVSPFSERDRASRFTVELLIHGRECVTVDGKLQADEDGKISYIHITDDAPLHTAMDNMP